MIDRLQEIYYVAWADLQFMRHSFLNILVMSVMSPLLYLVAFGYGMGAGVTPDGISHIAFVVPGIVALTTLSSSFSSTATRINVQKLFYKSFDEMMMSPLRLSSIIMGKATLGVLRGAVSAGIIFLIGLVITTGLHVTPLFVICLLASCFTFAFLGIMAALLARSHQSISTFSSMVILPMTFLCGTFFSVASLPAGLQVILYALPLTHSSTCIRAAALGQAFPWASFIVLMTFGAAFFAINMHILRSKRT